jgi:polyphosphate kinase
VSIPPELASELAAQAAAADARYLNRDLSWLEFNRRVLALAMDARTPLLERVKFLAIFGSNLDEFFMKRVGLLKHRLANNLTTPARPGEQHPAQTLASIRRVVRSLHTLQARCWEEDVRPALAEAGIRVLDYAGLPEARRRVVDGWFRENVFPILTPLAVDPGHRFPFISNLSENLGVLLETRRDARPERVFARVKIPSVLPQFVEIDALEGTQARTPDGRIAVELVALDDVIRNNLDDLFPGLTILDVLPFRVTRNAALEVEDDEADDLLEQVEAELRLRRFAHALRLQVNPSPSPEILRFVLSELELEDEDVYERAGPLAFADLFEIASIDRPDLKDTRWTPVVPERLADASRSIFDVIREKDVLVHHPYESFTHSAERFVAEAADDPDVLAIKQTLYRTSRNSPFVQNLIEAADAGKQVACLVEVRARFDEEKNVKFARQLEKHGVHVAYGVVGLKTHCKISMVVRREKTPDGRPTLRTYAHIGTGNYHPGTAQLYTDLGLLTADPVVTADIGRLFNALTGHAATDEYERLLVAPKTMRDRFVALIDDEIAHAQAGRPCGIIAKMNAMEDRVLTDKLYDASAAGVPVELIVRGFCCVRPGVPGLSETIRVRSVVGRFLEHSRIFCFRAGAPTPVESKFFMGSADWMYRNLSSRVEAVCPVDEPAARARLHDILGIMLADRRNAWLLGPDGVYTAAEDVPGAAGAPQHPAAAQGTFDALMQLSAAARGTQQI